MGDPQPASGSPGRISPATKILLGLAAGAAAGVICNIVLGPKHAGLLWFADTIANPAGQVFLRMLFMIVIPLVFCSLALGVAGLGSLKQVGRVGAKTLLYFLTTTLVAALIGILLVNALRPGDALARDTAERIRAEYQSNYESMMKSSEANKFGVNTFLGIIPKNPIAAAAKDEMLAVIFFALMVGAAASSLTSERSRLFLGFLEAVNGVCAKIIQFAMKLAPIGVTGLVFAVTAKFGFDIIKSLAYFVVTVLGGLAVIQFIFLPALAASLARVNPFVFIRRTKRLAATAFSLSSSNATLPTTLKTAQEEFGVPPHIAGFVVPLGATMNMNGTAIFEGVVVLFLAQVAGVELSVGSQLIVVVMTVLTAIGASGVPGGSLPLIAMVLAQVGIEPSMLAIVLGVDRILDMSRTVSNVTGDVVGAMYVARSEGVLAVPPRPPSES